MSVAFKPIFDRDMAKAVADLPDTMTWDGDDYECAVSTLKETATLEMAGMEIEYDAIIHVRRELFDPSIPSRGQTIVVKSKTLRVEGVEEVPDDVEIRLLCANVTR